jgi:hypothetical protein
VAGGLAVGGRADEAADVAEGVGLEDHTGRTLEVGRSTELGGSQEFLGVTAGRAGLKAALVLARETTVGFALGDHHCTMANRQEEFFSGQEKRILRR